MAENKKSFLLYTDVHHTVKKLTDLQAGQLFKHILSYVNDENPEVNDIIIDLVFEPIKQALKRDLKKYEDAKDKFSKAGKASARARLEKKPQLYIIECYNDKEIFIKIGITNNSLGIRYSGIGENHTIPYKYILLAQYTPIYDSDDIGIGELESLIRERLRIKNYKPKLSFAGQSECYYSDDYIKLIDFIKVNINNQRYLTTFNDVERPSTNPTVSVIDNGIDSVIDNDNAITKKKKNSFPDFIDFKNYALANNPSINLQSLELKYKAWRENNWRDGNNKKIENWKSKLLNTMPYLNNGKAVVFKSKYEQDMADLKAMKAENDKLLNG